MVDYKKFWATLSCSLFFKIISLGAVASCYNTGKFDLGAQCGFFRMYNDSYKDTENQHYEGLYCNARYAQRNRKRVDVIDLMLFTCSANKYGESFYDAGIVSKMEGLYPDFFSKHGSLGVISNKGFLISKSINMVSDRLSVGSALSLIGVGIFLDFRQSNFLPSSIFAEYFSGIGRTVYFGAGIEFKIYSSCRISSKFLVTPSLGVCINMLGFVFYDLEEFVDKNRAIVIITENRAKGIDSKVMGTFSCLDVNAPRISSLGTFPKFRVLLPIAYNVSDRYSFILSFDAGVDFTRFESKSTNIGFYVPRGHQCVIPVGKPVRNDAANNSDDKFVIVDNTSSSSDFEVKLMRGAAILHSASFNSADGQSAYIFRVKNREKLHGFMFVGVCLGLVYQY